MCNVGSLDRIFRILVGLAVISLVFIGPQTPWGWLGLILVVTGIFKFCPIYKILGIKTCSTKD